MWWGGGRMREKVMRRVVVLQTFSFFFFFMLQLLPAHDWIVKNIGNVYQPNLEKKRKWKLFCENVMMMMYFIISKYLKKYWNSSVWEPYQIKVTCQSVTTLSKYIRHEKQIELRETLKRKQLSLFYWFYTSHSFFLPFSLFIK